MTTPRNHISAAQGPFFVRDHRWAMWVRRDSNGKRIGLARQIKDASLFDYQSAAALHDLNDNDPKFTAIPVAAYAERMKAKASAQIAIADKLLVESRRAA